MQIFGVLLTFIIPALILWLEKRVKLIRVISPVLVCYSIGMLAGNMPGLEVDYKLSMTLGNACIAAAIPLMLFSMDIFGWMRLARSTVLSFSLTVVAAMVAAIVAHFIFSSRLPESEYLGGMLVGVYIGGTPNMAALGAAMGVESETFMKLNAADMIWSSLYLLWILAVARRLYALWLPAFPGKKEDNDNWNLGLKRPPLYGIVTGLMLAFVIVGAGWAISLLIPGVFRDPAAILIITTLAVAASFVKRVRNLPGTDVTGYYLLLVFSVALGSTAQFERLFEASIEIFLFTGVVIILAVGLHLLLVSFFKIDRDTVIITSTAAIWSPAMVPPVAMALKNRELLGPGIASGLVGYAVGNYAGLLLTWLLS